MGGGSWTSRSFADYTTTTKGMAVADFIDTSFSAQELYKARRLSAVLDPKNVMRECRDSEEHPNTLPVILALDVTFYLFICVLVYLFENAHIFFLSFQNRNGCCFYKCIFVVRHINNHKKFL